MGVQLSNVFQSKNLFHSFYLANTSNKQKTPCGPIKAGTSNKIIHFFNYFLRFSFGIPFFFLFPFHQYFIRKMFETLIRLVVIFKRFQLIIKNFHVFIKRKKQHNMKKEKAAMMYIHITYRRVCVCAIWRNKVLLWDAVIVVRHLYIYL